MAEGSNYVIAILLDAKDKNLKKVLEGAGHQVEDFTEKAEDSGSRIQKAFVGAGIAMAFGKAIPFMKQSIGLFNQATSAASGLQSAIRASGEDWDVAHAFLKEYTQDGLVPLTQASAALKNMLAGGYGLEESIGIMRTMKDYAAYGRQGQLSMGDAIERTTQGLKAQLSSLTDNAGWTKNLAVAHKEYAASIGKTVGKLTEAEKRTAIYVAIMKDGAAVQGDAAKASDELTGKLARQQARVRTLGEAVGESLAPGYERLLDKLGPATDGITAFAKANPVATATLLGGAGLVAAVGALSAALTLIGSGGAIMIGVVAGILALVAGMQTLIEKKRKAVERTRDLALASQEEARELRELAAEYRSLKSEVEPSADQQERIKEITESLVTLVPELTGLLPEQAEKFRDVAGAAETYADELEGIAARGETWLELEAVRTKARIEDLKANKKAIEEQLDAEIELADGRKALWRDLYPAEAGKYLSDLSAVTEEIDHQDARWWEMAFALARIKGLSLDLMPGLEGQMEAAGDSADYVAGKFKLAGSAAGGEKASLEDLIAAYEKLAEFKAEKLGIPPSLLFPPETVEEAVEQYIAFMDWIEELRDDAAERDAERDAEALERKKAALEDYYRTAKGKIERLAKEWDDLSNVGVRALQQTADTLGAALGTILSGTEDMAEKLREIWGAFINWLWMELGRIIARLIMAAILKAFVGGLDFSAVPLETVTQASAQGGGTILRPTRGVDYVPALLDGGETVLSVDLTRRVERMVNDWEAWRSPTPAVAMAEGYEAGVPAVIEEHYHFHSADFSSFDRALRGGQLGQSLRRAMQHGRLQR